MKKLKIALWTAGVLAVLSVVILRPQYALEAAKAVVLIMGENQCSCE